MLNTWTKLKYREPKNIHEIIQQPQWNNSLIKIDGKEANYETWKKAVVSHINDLIDNNGEIAKLEFLKFKFRFNCKQMEYNSIIHSIPSTWKNEVKKSSNIAGIITTKEYQFVINNKLCNIEEITTKEVNNHILIGKGKTPTSKQRWIDLYEDMDLDDSLWQYIYS
jgi:hypothetical protein